MFSFTIFQFEHSASGDAMDYADRLMEAEMNLQKMIMRDFPAMKDIADEELDLSEQSKQNYPPPTHTLYALFTLFHARTV